MTPFRQQLRTAVFRRPQSGKSARASSFQGREFRELRASARRRADDREARRAPRRPVIWSVHYVQVRAHLLSIINILRKKRSSRNCPTTQNRSFQHRELFAPALALFSGQLASLLHGGRGGGASRRLIANNILRKARQPSPKCRLVRPKRQELTHRTTSPSLISSANRGFADIHI
jgi:hypothetical protein